MRRPRLHASIFRIEGGIVAVDEAVNHSSEPKPDQWRITARLNADVERAFDPRESNGHNNILVRRAAALREGAAAHAKTTAQGSPLFGGGGLNEVALHRPTGP